MDLIIADVDGYELSYLRDVTVDVDIGGKNDFQLTMTTQQYESTGWTYGYSFYAPNTEYGGLITDVKVSTKTDTVYLLGDTWRGMLARKIIEPPSGQDYRVVSGEANSILRRMIEPLFDGLFTVPGSSGITIGTYGFDRYTDVLTGLTKMLSTKGARLDISYTQGPPGDRGYVVVKAVPIVDYSATDEYTTDSRVNFTAQDYRTGINHLICLGKGELKDRTVLHLYVQADGSIGDTQYYTGVNERTATYDYSSVESVDELRTKGTEKLEELKNYTKFEMTVDDVDMAIGDIIGGREYITGIVVKQPVVQKILKIKNGAETISHKLKGDD